MGNTPTTMYLKKTPDGFEQQGHEVKAQMRPSKTPTAAIATPRVFETLISATAIPSGKSVANPIKSSFILRILFFTDSLSISVDF